MLNKGLYILSIGLLFCSCQQKKYATLAPEYLYDGKGQQVITSLIKNKDSTISLVYGNDLAHIAAQNSLPAALPGASYTLVTWKQKNMPGWYGTTMNGPIYSIETLNVLNDRSKGLKLDYHFRPGKAFLKGSARPDQAEQVRYIIAQRVAVMP